MTLRRCVRISRTRTAKPAIVIDLPRAQLIVWRSGEWEWLTACQAERRGAVACIECGKVYDKRDPEEALWAALGPEGVTLDEALIYCPDCAADD